MYETDFKTVMGYLQLELKTTLGYLCLGILKARINGQSGVTIVKL